MLFTDRPLRLGTRGSPLALAQARMTAQALIAAHGWSADAIEIITVQTSGDRIQDRALADIGGKALWTKELDRALVAGETDLSVHSMKDVETLRPDMFHIAAMLPRADVRELLEGWQYVCGKEAYAEELAESARKLGRRKLIATSVEL